MCILQFGYASTESGRPTGKSVVLASANKTAGLSARFDLTSPACGVISRLDFTLQPLHDTFRHTSCEIASDIIGDARSPRVSLFGHWYYIMASVLLLRCFQGLWAP